jgi:hypothetical protein
MEFISKYLYDKLPEEIIRKIYEFEYSTKKFHIKIILDPYTIYSKNIICRQLEKYSNESIEIYINKTIRWDAIIKYNQEFDEN